MHGKQAKLPQNLKWSVNIARLENGIYEEIVAHLENWNLTLCRNLMTRELPQWPQHLASHKTCYLMALIPYCKAGESFWNSGCSNLKKLRETDAKDGRKHQGPIYPESPTCSKPHQAAKNEQVLIFDPNGLDRTPKQRLPPTTTKTPPKTEIFTTFLSG